MDESGKRPNDRRPTDIRKVRFRLNGSGSRGKGKGWIPVISAVSFFLSISLLFMSSNLMEGVNVPVALLVVLLIICVGILFDIVGISVTAADEAPFHAMSSRKVFGAKLCIRLVRNASKVSSICNDVVGDICSVISGSASAFIIVRMTTGMAPAEAVITGLAVSGVVASLTVGGKAFGKTVAIENSNYIVYRVGVLLTVLIGWSGRFGSKNRI